MLAEAMNWPEAIVEVAGYIFLAVLVYALFHSA